MCCKASYINLIHVPNFCCFPILLPCDFILFLYGKCYKSLSSKSNEAITYSEATQPVPPSVVAGTAVGKAWVA